MVIESWSSFKSEGGRGGVVNRKGGKEQGREEGGEGGRSGRVVIES